MTEQLMHVEINCETNEQVARPLTAEEIAKSEADRIAFEAAEAERIAAEAAKAEKRAAVLAALANAAGLDVAEVEEALS